MVSILFMFLVVYLLRRGDSCFVIISDKMSIFSSINKYDDTMKMNMKQWVADVIRQKEVKAVPVMTHPGIEQNGHTVRQAVSDGRVHAEAVSWLTQHYPSAAACTIMDLTTEAEAFGAQIAFSDEAVPAVSGRLLPDVESIYRLQVPSLSAGRIPAYLKANLLAVREVTDRPLFSGCIGPFSLAGRLYDMSEIMVLSGVLVGLCEVYC